TSFHPRQNRALGNTERPVRDDQGWFEFHSCAEAHAGFTGTMWAVEREVARFEFGVAKSAFRAGKFLGERKLLAINDLCDGDAVTHPQCDFQRIDEPHLV